MILSLIVGLITITASFASDHIKNVSIEYRRLLNQPRLLELPTANKVDYLGLNLNLKLFGPIYWDNLAHLYSSSDRVKWVGWLFELGIKVSKFDLFYKHHSQHTLDGVHPFMDFPVNDGVGFRWRVYP